MRYSTARLAAAFSLICSAAAAQTYTTTTLEYPTAIATYPTAQNKSGTIVGYWYNSQYVLSGWIYQGGKLSNLVVPTSTSTYPVGINDKGEVSGTFADKAGTQHGFLYSVAAGTFTTVDLPGSNSTGLGQILNNGLVDGAANDANGQQEIFTYRKGHFDVVIDNGLNPSPSGINKHGTIVGQATTAGQQPHAYIFLKGKFSIIPFGNDFSSQSFAVNTHNVVVGQFVYPDYSQSGFIYSAKDGEINLIEAPGASNCFFNSINDTGTAAGTCNYPGVNSKAWVYGKAYDLTFGISGATNVGAVSISNSGQVIGYLTDANNVGGTFIAVPSN